MKFVHVMCDNDYDALEFEQVHGKSPSLDIWNLAKTGRLDCGEFSLSVEALEFSDIDPKFLNFMWNELIDEDHQKHANIFLVKES